MQSKPIIVLTTEAIDIIKFIINTFFKFRVTISGKWVEHLQMEFLKRKEYTYLNTELVLFIENAYKTFMKDISEELNFIEVQKKYVYEMIDNKQLLLIQNDFQELIHKYETQKGKTVIDLFLQDYLHIF